MGSGFSGESGNGRVWLICACLLFFGYQMDAQVAPSFVPPTINVGDIIQQTPIVFTAKFRNSSSKSIRIAGLAPGCDCTKISLKSVGSILKPNQEILIPGEISKYLAEGVFRVDIIAWTLADGESKEKVSVCSLVGNILSPIKLSQPFFHFPDDGGSVRKMTFRVSRGNAPVPWDEIRCIPYPSSMKAKANKINSDVYEVSLSLETDKLDIGRFSGNFAIELFAKGKMLPFEYRFAVEADVQGAFSASPAAIYVGLLNGDVQKSFSVNTDLPTISLESVTSQSGSVAITSKNVKANVLEVSCSIRSSAYPAGTISDRITLDVVGGSGDTLIRKKILVRILGVVKK